MEFKKDFIWGVATAAYQIEGACEEDGKGQSIWDVHAHTPGRITDGSNGDVACDFYHRYEEDIELMAKLGVKAYRFSISWARILPDGVGKINQKGIDFYNRVIDLLLKKGIEPYITLYHWDLPSAIYNNGGFKRDKIVEEFLEYTEVVCKSFGDRVKNFITFNEPSSFIIDGYVNGYQAPAEKVDTKTNLEITHRMLLCHGEAVKKIRKEVKGAKVGIATASWIACPKNDGAYEKAKEVYFSIKGGVTIYLDPIIKGDYPKDYYETFKDCLPQIKEGDMETINQPIDYCYHNIYTGYKVDENGNIKKAPTFDGATISDIGWQYMPESIYYGCKMLYERYGLPIIISESGVSMTDIVNADGQIRDYPRIDWISGYLKELRRASDDGVDIAGYFVWSFCDNFEWSEGYRFRFGLVHVDYQTLKRTPKASFYWYNQVIKSNGGLLL